jgi:hypothetical protein
MVATVQISGLISYYLAYQSWTVLTALPTTLFYFSVWKLALAGSELSTFAVLSPLFLAVPPFHVLIRSRSGRTVLAAISALCGIGCWWLESMWLRLLGVVVGVMASNLRWAGEWMAEGEGGVIYHSSGMFLLSQTTREAA